MNKNKDSKLPVLLGVALWEGYRFYKGKGIFNKLRYKKEHNAVSNYLETHYPDAFYSDIVMTDDGYTCVINNYNKKIMLHFAKTEDNNFVFWEKEI